MSVNKVILLGHVGQIETKSFDGQNGPRKCATFSLATTERYKDRNGNQVENTEWHSVVSWNHAELCEKYVQKGTRLYVEGHLKTRSWEDKQGAKKYVTEVIVERIDLLGNTKTDGQPSQYTPQPQPQQRRQTEPYPPVGPAQDDDLPFK